MIITKMLDILRAARINQAKYQLQVPCFLSSLDSMEASVKEIAEHLMERNGNIKPLKTYQAQNPVYQVLEGKGVLKKTQAGYKLNGNFTQKDRNQISKLCKERLN